MGVVLVAVSPMGVLLAAVIFLETGIPVTIIERTVTRDAARRDRAILPVVEISQRNSRLKEVHPRPPRDKEYFHFLKQLVSLEEKEENEEIRTEFLHLSPKERELRGKALLGLVLDEKHFSPAEHILATFSRQNKNPLPLFSLEVGDVVSLFPENEKNFECPTGTVYEKSSHTLTVAFNQELPETLAYGERNNGNIVNYSLGMGFSLNDRVAFNMQLVGAVVGRTQLQGQVIDGSSLEIVNLLFSTTILATSKLFLEPIVGIGLTEDAFDATIGLRIPYRF